MPRENKVPYPPSGIAIAVQYWLGDEEPALRLARLIADIEPDFRSDVTLVLARRKDCPLTPAAWETGVYCGKKFRVMRVKSERDGTGHPDGCFALWAGTMDKLASLYYGGEAQFDRVLTVEADGCPIAPDWINRLKREHELGMVDRRRVLGALGTTEPRHINGTLMTHLSLWRDRLSLHETPPGHAWDFFHAPVLMAEAYASTLIANVYGHGAWSPASLRAMARSTVWMSNCKDDSVVAWAERNVVALAFDVTDRVVSP